MLRMLQVISLRDQVNQVAITTYIHTNNMDEKILVKFKKQSYEKIVREAKKKGLPKSTLVRMITLKALADEI